jgi:hypothetical protein
MEARQFPAGSKIYRYKLDFYYQQSLLYLITLIGWAGIRGTFSFERLPALEADPILYIIGIFVIVSLVVLALNKARDRRLVVTPESIVFHSKNRERVIAFTEIEWMHIGRERSVTTAGRSQVIVFKTKDRRRLFRIRIGRYERERELLAEMHAVAQKVPRRKRYSAEFA